jgi:exodeoxyribonuclease III
MSKSLKIISWNVNGIRAIHKKGLQSFLERQKPDVFCVQETKCKLNQVQDERYESLFPQSYWSEAEKAGYSGTAVFTKIKPIEVHHGINMKEYDSEGRFVITEFPEFLLYNVYFPNGGMGDERHNFKQNFLQDFTDHLAEKINEGKEIIVVGDYNVAHQEIDVYDPKRLSTSSGFLPEEREWFDGFLETGFVDTFRHFYPTLKDKYTWWSYRERAKEHNRGWRIDYMCMTPGLLPYVKSFKHLDMQAGSDHCPLEIILGF